MIYATAFFRAFDIDVLDYPWEAALNSALDWCDEIIVVAGTNSTDDTVSALQDFQDVIGSSMTVIPAHIKFTERSWQEDWWNLCRHHVNPASNWHIWLDLDELVARPIEAREALNKKDVDLVRFSFCHLFGSAFWSNIRFPLTHNTRAGRTRINYRMVNLEDGAACAAVYGKEGINAHHPNNPNMVTLDTPILHYGWCRNAEALAESQRRHHVWYGKEVPESWNSQFQFDILGRRGRGDLVAYSQPHPYHIHEWLEAHETEWNTL